MQLVKVTNVKNFMNKLLIENSFDSFLISEATVKTFNTFVFDGHVNEGFFSTEQMNELRAEAEKDGRIFSEKLSRWSQIKPTILSIIKGKNTPLYFKMSFYLAEENINKLLSNADTSITSNDIDGLSLIVKYAEGELTITSSVSLKIFSLDKSLDKIWDDMVVKFLASQNIDAEVM